MPSTQKTPLWLQKILSQPYGRLALKLICDWQRGRYRNVTTHTVTVQGEEIEYLSLGKCWCVECELHHQDLLDSLTIQEMAELIVSEIEKRGEINVFLEDVPGFLRLKPKRLQPA